VSSERAAIRAAISNAPFKQIEKVLGEAGKKEKIKPAPYGAG
jgi:hypothetical protein